MLTRPADLVGTNARFVAALESAEKAAKQDITILIRGETGSGKGRVAELVHEASEREGRFLSINCAAFQPALFESELFGYMKGAFTGADKDTPGLFESAEGGTLFLDEIADTPPEIQPKLLRAVEQGVIRRVGGRDEIPVDVRLVCATNKDLQALIRAGKFREDLYYRINSFIVTLPPLRERVDDIEQLAESFLREFSGGKRTQTLAADTLRTLRAYSWPGNVRELRSAIQHACAQSEDAREVLPEHLPVSLIGPSDQFGAQPEHQLRFAELDEHGGADPVRWARFLIALMRYTGNELFSRSDVLECLRARRGEDAKEHALAYEWLHHIKPTGVKLGLIIEEGKKVAINREACEALLQVEPSPQAAPPRRPTGPLPVMPERRNTNVTGARTSFVGRTTELNDLCKTIREGNHQIVTITGPGGMGKTRIAREATRKLADSFAGGAWFVDLVEAHDTEGVASAVAQALGVPINSDQPSEQFIANLLELREPTLLVLDNFEQVVESAPDTVALWAECAPQIRFLVTSRARLAVQGEFNFSLESLPLPQPDDDAGAISRNEAVHLFVERAKLQHASFGLTDANARDLAAICARLEGIPLAIELAAARIAVLKPAEILAWLDKLLPMLETDQKDVATRHRSLQAAIAWSVDLLSERDRDAFMKLSVFRGGFFIDAATAVLGDDDAASRLNVLNVIQRLVGSSLLRAQETPYGNRFSMYVAIHEFAQNRLQEALSPEDQEALRKRHAVHYRDYVEAWNREGHGPRTAEALDRLDFERANVQRAMDWAAPPDSNPSPERRRLFIQLAGYMSPTLIIMRGPVARHIPVLRRALTLADPDWHQSRIALSMTVGILEKITGMHTTSAALLKETIRDAEEHGIDQLLALSCSHMADNIEDGEPDEALKYRRRALALFEKNDETKSAHACRTSIAQTLASKGEFTEALRELTTLERLITETGDLFALCHLYLVRGNVHAQLGDHARAFTDLRESEKLALESKNPRHLAHVRLARFDLLHALRRIDEAQAALEEAAEKMFEYGDLRNYAICLAAVASLHIELGRPEKAEPLLRRVISLPIPPVERETAAACRADLGLARALGGNVDAGEALVREGFELVSRGAESSVVMASLPEVLLMAGKFDATLQEVERAEAALLAAPRHACRTPRTHFRLLFARSEALRELGRRDEARQAATRALEAATEAGYTPDDPAPTVTSALDALNATLAN